MGRVPRWLVAKMPLETSVWNPKLPTRVPLLQGPWATDWTLGACL